MEIKIESSSLLKAASLAATAKGDGKAMPIFSTVLIRADKDKQSVSVACGTESRLLKVNADGENTAVAETGNGAIGFDLLAGLLRTVPEGTQLSLKTSGRKADLSWPGGTASVPCDGIADHNGVALEATGDENETVLETRADELLSALKAAARCASGYSPLYPFLENLCISVREGGAEIVGTDNKCLCVTSVSGKTEGNASVLFPPAGFRAALEMLSAAADGEASLRVTQGDRRIAVLSAGDAVLSIVPATGKFPDWQKLLGSIPAPAATVHVGSKDMSSALERLSVTAENGSLIKMSVKPGDDNKVEALALEGRDLNMKSAGRENVPVKGEGTETFSTYHIPEMQKVVKNFPGAASLKFSVGGGQKTPLLVTFGDDCENVPQRKMLLVPVYSK